MQLSFTPTLDRAEACRRLERLLVPEPLRDRALAVRVERLSHAFRNFLANYPLPLWAPGLVIDHEMRGMSEALFPMKEVRPLFDRVLRCCCRFEPLLHGTYLYSSPTWLDFLHRLRPQLKSADPASLLRTLAEESDMRVRFLFSLMLPHHFGGGFGRYPAQAHWLLAWLLENQYEFREGIRVLDSACGSGEGTYEVAALVCEAGIPAEGSVVHGSTLEPIELFAAAHLFFPHDPDRERACRAKTAPLLTGAGRPRLEFYLDQVGSRPAREPYHLVLCNGLLGGPLLHEPEALDAAIAGLSGRLAPGGVLVAADRFHAGWRQRIPTGVLRALLEKHALVPIETPEGIAAAKAR